MLEPEGKGVERNGGVLDAGSNEGSDGRSKPDRVDLVECEFVIRGGAERVRIVAISAANGLERYGVESGAAERPGEEGGGEGFADRGIGAGDEGFHVFTKFLR